MRVLWLTNVLFPDACKELGIPAPVVGGWMHSGAKALLNANQELTLAVVSLYEGKSLKWKKINDISYYFVPNSNKDIQLYNSDLLDYFREVQSNFLPDIVHIHGTEYPHSLSWVKACGSLNVVASIQGMASVYANYYFGGLSIKEVLRTRTLRDFLRRDSLWSQKKKMDQRGQHEIKLINKISNIIGRTGWDRANVLAINQTINYYCCNETLRDAFYKKKWEYKNCEKHTIFLSQVHYPIKGFHQLLHALPIILKNFKDTKVYVAGNAIRTNKLFGQNGYEKYLNALIKSHNLKDTIVYLGTLTEDEMSKQFLNANVFLCPSSIENSPNSIGEAQLVGIPCVASYVGGTMDMIEDRKSGSLYRFEEVALLADKISELFRSKELCELFSEEGRKVARKRHSKELNASELNRIYKRICNNDI